MKERNTMRRSMNDRDRITARRTMRKLRDYRNRPRKWWIEASRRLGFVRTAV